MKKFIASSLAASAVFILLNGCVASIGNQGPAHGNATLGQQLIDLQKAREANVITEAEYQAQRKKLLGEK